MFDHWKPREKMSDAEMRKELAFLKGYPGTANRNPVDLEEMRPELHERRRQLIVATELAD
jgi:hypothetical protein